ncbi:ABC transporter permease DevC [Dulcicalothrix desertica]|nr:ABC transporter permease DevC [Dulcicalothrix desertica]TWH55623.1 putative ABC transport system permease protein [Dulcicalothrix desertica PCC 7102]
MLNKLFRKTPLAWRQVMKEKTRLAVAVAGIAFADILIFVQMGFEASLYTSATKANKMLDGDLIVVDRQFQSLSTTKSFSRDRLYQVLSYSGVKSVSSIYTGMGQWKNAQTDINRAIMIWGIEPDGASFKLPELRRNASELKLLNSALFDLASRPEYGNVAESIQKQGQIEASLNRRDVLVSGLFNLGTSFTADGNVIVGDSTFLRLFPGRQAYEVDVGLIQLKPGVNPISMRAQLSMGLPKDIKIFTKEEFVAAERHYVESGGTIGFIFGLGVIVGFIVGIVIVYQILYTDVANHLPEYATLKAMGYGDKYFIGVLMQEALLLAAFGFIPGYLVSVGIYQIAYVATLLPIGMTVERAVHVFLLTVVMCTFSGAIALGKLQSADPADVF